MVSKLKKWIIFKFSKELQIVRDFDYVLLFLFYKLIKRLNDNQILICSESRSALSGNLLYIDRKIDKNTYDVIYSLKKDIIEKRTFKQKRMLCRQLATSKYIIIDDFMPVIYPLPLRKETRLIQVWHAMGAFKKVGFSRLGKPGGPSPRSLTHRNYTDAIVSSQSIRADYAEAFHIPLASVHALGIPRSDIFFDSEYKERTRASIYEKYPCLRNKKVVLFAPTFRGNGIRTAHYDYSWLSFAELEKQLGSDYMVIIKLHPFIKERPAEKLDSDFYLDLSDEREINDLLFVTDVLVTDYSSVIFEASLLGIRTVFYVPDFEEYVASRDFYYPFSDYTYGDVAGTEDELIGYIKAGKLDAQKLAAFREKFCGCCDGNCARRFVEFFFSKI